jgi:hypothetical protein
MENVAHSEENLTKIVSEFQCPIQAPASDFGRVYHLFANKRPLNFMKNGKSRPFQGKSDKNCQ